MNVRQTAQAAGFCMPAEWETHSRCWMAWPGRPDLWDDLALTQRAYARVADTIAQFEPVTMIVHPDQAAVERELLPAAIAILPLPIDEAWARDTGPLFLRRDRQLAGCTSRFNAWGRKHQPFADDDRLGLEGGALHDACAG